MFKFLKDLIIKLLILIIVILIASRIINTKNNTQIKNEKNISLIQKQETENKTDYNKHEKDEINKKSTSNDQEELNKLIEKLNAHIDEQTYLLSYYVNDLNEEKIKILENNIMNIKKDAKNKKVSHLIDMTQIEELENQLDIYQHALQQKNESL